MKTTNHPFRRTLPLLGAAALVGSALLASTGATLAGKELPTATATGSDCTAQSQSSVRYRVSYDLSANKGKWAFVSAELILEQSGFVETNYPVPTQVDQSASELQVTATAMTEEPATMRLSLFDRKDRELTLVETSFCQYPN